MAGIMTQVTTAFSYIRFSSSAQELGDSLRRQMKAAEDAAEAHGWILSKQSYQDLGVSGYKAGAKRDGLQMLVDAIHAGSIRAGSVIIIEQLDRLSRQGIDATQDLVKTILRAGVELYSVSDGLHLTRDSLNDLISIIRLVVAADLAHKESEKKSERLTAAKGAKRERILAGSKEGMACPFWLKFDAEKKEYFLTEWHTLVQQMIGMRLKLMGHVTIANHCNSLCKSPRGGTWTPQTIKRILSDHALYGTKSIMTAIKPGSRSYRITDVVHDYYPALIDFKTYEELQRVASQTTPGNSGTDDRYTNILRGMTYCKCGKAMSGQYRKVRGKEYIYIFCKGVQEGTCNNTKHYRIDKLASALISHVKGLTKADILGSSSDAVQSDIKRLENELARATANVARYLDLIDKSDMPVDEIAPRLAQANNDKKRLEADLAAREIEVQTNLDPALYTEVPDLYDYSARQELNADLKRIIRVIETESDTDSISMKIVYHSGRVHRLVLDAGYIVRAVYLKEPDQGVATMDVF